MRQCITFFFLFHSVVFTQSTSFDFHSTENIKKFADHLFCEGDYLRAIEQYELINEKMDNDTIEFKVMLGYSELGLYGKSIELFESCNYESVFYPDCYLLSLKNELILEKHEFEYPSIPSFDASQWKSFGRLFAISMLYSDAPVVPKEKFLQIFEKDEQSAVSLLYDYRFEPPYKSPALAGILSAIVPGSGKMYVGEWGDGITALVVTSLFAFLAYDNFRADHTTRAWIFTGLGAFFYAGNIYGSVASAQIFNTKIDFEFNDGLELFLKQQNYFLPEYDFCN